jgi:hypothetical protein
VSQLAKDDDIINIGCSNKHAYDYMEDIPDELRNKFPHGRSTYWQTDILFPPYVRRDDSLMQTSKESTKRASQISSSTRVET